MPETKITKQKLKKLINNANYLTKSNKEKWLQLLKYLTKSQYLTIYDHFEKQIKLHNEIKLKLVTKYGHAEELLSKIKNSTELFLDYVNKKEGDYQKSKKNK
jgi:hypothetical protein